MRCEVIKLDQRNWPNTRVLVQHLKKLLGIDRFDRRYYYRSKNYNTATLINLEKSVKVIIHYRVVQHAHMDTMEIDEYISVIDVVVCRV